MTSFYQKLVCRSCILVSTFLFLSIPAQAFEIPVSKNVLDNGMTVVISDMPTSPMVSVYALVKVGSATEEPYLGSGISHFLEHMLFKGTERHAVGEIPAKIQAVGGSVNASTSKDYTIYTITVPYEAFDTALDVLADMLMNSKFDPEETEKERTVILSEMRLHNDNPQRVVDQLAFENVYLEHPYRHPVIGYKDLFNAITVDDLKNFYRTYYVPNNIVFSVAGRVDEEVALSKIKETFKTFHRQKPIYRNIVEEKPQITARHHEEEFDTPLTRMIMAFQSVPLLDEDLFALDMLAKVLGQGGSSRLYLDLYHKKRVVDSVNAYNYTPIDKGVFVIETVLDYNDRHAVVEEVWKHIKVIQRKGVKTDELEKVKRQALSEHIRAYQRSSHMAGSHASDEAFAGDPQFSQKYVEGIQKVSVKDIQRMAQQYLHPERLTTVLLKPKTLEDSVQDSVDKKEIGQIQKHVLGNGLTVLLREDHTFPLMSIRLVMQGGLRADSPHSMGISNLAASLWCHDTKSRSTEKIAKETEALGMRIGSFSGKNSMGLRIDALSQDGNFALELLEDVAHNSVFSDKDIEKIKDRFIVNRSQRYENLFKFSAQELDQLLFTNHPYGYDILGEEESFNAFSRDDVIDFFEKIYVPENIVIGVFGDINNDEVLSTIKRRFGHLPAQKFIEKTYTEEPIQKLRYKEFTRDKEQALVVYGFHAPSLSDKDRYGVEVLTAILGSSFNGRMFTNIRDKLGKAYTLGGSYIPGIEIGSIRLYVSTTQENVEIVKELLNKEIQILHDELVSEKELQDIKSYLIGRERQGLETNQALNFTSALDELYGLGFDHYQNYDTNINRVTSEYIKSLANIYLDLNKVAVVVTMPETQTDKDDE